MNLCKKILKWFPDLPVKTDIYYREVTTLGVGSTIPVLVEPESCEELSKLVAKLSAKKNQLFYPRRRKQRSRYG